MLKMMITYHVLFKMMMPYLVLSTLMDTLNDDHLLIKDEDGIPIVNNDDDAQYNVIKDERS